MDKTFDLDLTVGASWSYTAGKYFLTIAGYQAKVNQLGNRWEWNVAYAQGFLTVMAVPFDHGTTDQAYQSKAAAIQAIQDHNAKRRAK